MNIDINCPSQRILLGWGIILSVPGFYAYALAQEGRRVLAIDADPQGDLSVCFGYKDQDDLEVTLATKLGNVIQDKVILQHR